MEQIQERSLVAFSKETTDASWSRDAARVLESSLHEGLPEHSRLLSIDCRTSMCLVEVRYEDVEAASHVLEAGFGSWPGAVLVAGEATDRGEVVKTILALREGSQPPY
jgi:hypothetical protein